MANFFTRAIDKITPWRMPGEVQRDQQVRKKKRQDEQQQQQNPVQSQGPTVQQPQNNMEQPKPALDFAALRAPKTSVRIPQAQEYDAQALDNAGVKKPQQSILDKVKDQVDANSQADKYRRAQAETQKTSKQLVSQGIDQPKASEIAAKQAKQNMNTTNSNTVQSNATNVLRSQGSVASNLAGGLLGMAKGVVELPSAALNTPKLIRFGAAKLTGNKQAEQNIANDKGTLSKLAEAYDRMVRPVTSRLTTAETATDTAANKLAPFAPTYVKPAAKVTANIIPVDALAAGLVGLSRARNVSKLAKEGEIVTGAPGTAGTTSRVPQDIGNLLSEGDITDLIKPPTQVPVTQVGGDVPIPVGRPNPVPIRELGGDTPGKVTIPTPQQVAEQQATSRFKAQAPGAPDLSIDGVTPRTNSPFQLDQPKVQATQDKITQDYADMLKSLGEGNGVNITADGRRVSNNVRSADNKGKRMTKADWRAEAESQLANGKAEPGIQKAWEDAQNPEIQSMLNQEPAAKGQPIRVKEVKGIPVVDKTVVPTGMPEAPGTVRATASAEPAQAQAQAVASQPQPIPIPKVGTILSDGTKVTKRTVKAARENNKRVKQLAKAQAETQSVIDNSPTLGAKPEGNPGFVPTGRFVTGKRGNVRESASKTLEETQGAIDTANLSVSDVLTKAKEEVNASGSITDATRRNLKAIRDSGQYAKTSPEYKAVTTEYQNAISHHAAALSMTDKAARGTSTGEQLANRFVNKILPFMEDSGKLTDAHVNQINSVENAFTQARDAATAAADRFKATGDKADFDAWKVAQKQADDADKQATLTEHLVAKDILKGNKDPDALKALQKTEKDAGVYTMDAVDANMLSGTGTWVRNFLNTALPRVENTLFGKVSSRIVKPIATVGGYSHRGAKTGAQAGQDLFKSDVNARKVANAGFIRRNVTAANTVGERNIQAVAYSKSFDHYRQLLKKEGYSGKELNDRAEFQAKTDPQGLTAQYEADALQANALSSLVNSKKMENWLADRVQNTLVKGGFGSNAQQAGRFGAKAVTRVGVGFPTVIARSLIEGVKRFTLGLPEAGWSLAKFSQTGNKDQLAQELAKSLQHAGSGATLMTVGAMLGKQGVMSGAYPTDPAERDKWTAEGTQPNSIKIGGQWFSIPGYFGGFALPLMMGNALSGGISGIKDTANLENAWQTVLDASPVDNIQSTLDILTGNATEAKIKNQITSLARTATPAGALLAQIARMTDKTKNDTTTKDAIHNILDNIAGGIPGLNNAVNKVDKTDAYGNVLTNPNPLAIVAGAQGSEQKQGQQNVQEAQNTANDSYKQLTEAGVTDNKTLMGLVDNKIQAQMKSGQKLTPDQVKSVQKAVTKGIGTGITADSDSNWRENGDYATDKVALKAKLQMLEADPTAKKSDISHLKTQISRSDILEKNKVNYEDLKLYQSTTQADWRKMGNPESEDFDPDTYQKLAALDKMLTDGKGSYAKDPTKAKYEVYTGKGKGSGSGKSGKAKGGPGSAADFGTLGSSSGPKVKEYSTSVMSGGGGVPVISVKRPNIVHKISSN